MKLHKNLAILNYCRNYHKKGKKHCHGSVQKEEVTWHIYGYVWRCEFCRKWFAEKEEL